MQTFRDGWIPSNKLGTGAALRECDTNCDGVINNADMTNSALTGNVASAYVSAKTSGTGACTERSPWSTGLSLWLNNGAALSTPSARVVAVGQSGNQIGIVAADSKGSVVHQKIITAD